MRKKTATIQMFTNAEDLPLFSGTPQRAIVAAFSPQETAHQMPLEGMRLTMHQEAKKVKDTKGNPNVTL